MKYQSGLYFESKLQLHSSVIQIVQRTTFIFHTISVSFSGFFNVWLSWATFGDVCCSSYCFRVFFCPNAASCQKTLKGNCIKVGNVSPKRESLPVFGGGFVAPVAIVVVIVELVVVLLGLPLQVGPVLPGRLVTVELFFGKGFFVLRAVVVFGVFKVLAAAAVSDLELVVLRVLVVVIFLIFGLGVEEAPSTALKESLWVVDDRLHDFGPVQGLDSLGVFDIGRAEKI